MLILLKRKTVVNWNLLISLNFLVGKNLKISMEQEKKMKEWSVASIYNQKYLALKLYENYLTIFSSFKTNLE